MKKTVTGDAEVTPKPMAICCAVLAMELAQLSCSSLISAYTSVFMLVYCSDNAWVTARNVFDSSP